MICNQNSYFKLILIVTIYCIISFLILLNLFSYINKKKKEEIENFYTKVETVTINNETKIQISIPAVVNNKKTYFTWIDDNPNLIGMNKYNIDFLNIAHSTSLNMGIPPKQPK